MEEKKDSLQTFKVPKVIKVLSVIFIIGSIIYGITALFVNIISTGGFETRQLDYLFTTLQNVITGFLFWGVGQVFEKIMETKKWNSPHTLKPAGFISLSK